MIQGFMTPTHVLILLGVVLLLFGSRILPALGRSTGRAVARPGVRRVLFGTLTIRQAHILWLIASLLIAFAFTRGVALPLFVGLFFILWLCGFVMLVRKYR